jgi:tetratricopeptide (TPR) repeat protein
MSLKTPAAHDHMNTAARERMRSIWQPIAATAAALAIIVVSPSLLRAQSGADWVGKRVVPKARGFVLRIDDEPVERSGGALVIYRVEKAEDGAQLWLKAEGQRLSGSAKVAEIVPVESAIDFFTDQIRMHPDDAFLRAVRALVRNDRDDTDGALRDYDEAIRLDAKRAALYCARAAARSARKEFDKAITDYGEAIRLDPKCVVAYSNRGAIREARGEHDKAIEDYSEAIWLEPLAISAYYHRGLAWQAKKEYEKAIVDYNVVLRLDPRNVAAYNSRSLARRTMKEYGRALADCDEAIAIAPNEPVAYDHRAWIWATCLDSTVRDGKRAVESATKACELTGWKNASYLATLAASCAELGDFESAVQWQTRANSLISDPAQRRTGEERLKLYQEKRPCRETSVRMNRTQVRGHVWQKSRIRANTSIGSRFHCVLANRARS